MPWKTKIQTNGKNRTEHSQAVGQYEMSNICVTGIPKGEERKHKM